MAMFEYKGAVHLMVAYENKSVQILDFETGVSLFEFKFNDRPVPIPTNPEIKDDQFLT